MLNYRELLEQAVGQRSSVFHSHAIQQSTEVPLECAPVVGAMQS